MSAVIVDVALIATQVVLVLLTLAIILILGYGVFSRAQDAPGLAAWFKKVFRAGSRFVAAACNAPTGNYSFSAECGSRDGAFWNVAEACIDFVLAKDGGERHCRGAAIREGLQPKN